MKRDFDEAKLLDAVLADESWESCNARLHGDALAALRAGKKSRARWMTAAQIMALAALLGAMWWSFSGPRDVPGSQQLRRDTAFANLSQADLRSDVLRTGDVSRSADNVPYITEEQMLAMFPEGSCVLAEVDGQKQLVVLDEAAARRGFQTQ